MTAPGAPQGTSMPDQENSMHAPKISAIATYSGFPRLNTRQEGSNMALRRLNMAANMLNMQRRPWDSPSKSHQPFRA